jgi:lipopolysaccharide transport system ATP-binding protein
MSDIAIRAEHLGKSYRVRHQNLQRYKTLQEDLLALPRRLWSGVRGTHAADETFWALDDVSFEVQQGEVLGIIGRNGAGKSTLLKILSRITEPTKGRAEIYGRVGSLLEVGTGFHPELTGRENVYLNGAILGMRRGEIARRFDEIVEFAEIQRFIDTPVKRYSSGMYMRLAFAVAAHLEPEILLVDEVLAVGDASFQRKCLDKMQDVGQQGRTVFFVSHNMPAITRLCQRVILVEAGHVLQDGPSDQVVASYLGSNMGTTAQREWSDLSRAPGNDVVRLRAVRVRTEDGAVTDSVDIRKPIGIDVEYEVLKPGIVLVPNLHCYNQEGVHVFVAADQDPAWRRRPRPLGRFVSTAWIPGNFLAEGTMILGAAISTMDPLAVHCHERDAVAFQVVDSTDGDSARGDFAGPIPGVVRPLLSWTTQSGLPDAEQPAHFAEEARL